MLSFRLIFLLWSLTLTAAYEQAEDPVDEVLQTQILQDSLVQANEVLQEQTQAEIRLNVTNIFPGNCQRAHAGFHAKPSKEVILRGKVARLLELATLQVGISLTVDGLV